MHARTHTHTRGFCGRKTTLQPTSTPHTHTHTHAHTRGFCGRKTTLQPTSTTHTHTRTHAYTHTPTWFLWTQNNTSTNFNYTHTHTHTVSVKHTTLTKRVPRERFQSDPARFAWPDISHVTTNRDRTNRCRLNKPPMTRLRCEVLVVAAMSPGCMNSKLKAQITACII